MSTSRRSHHRIFASALILGLSGCTNIDPTPAFEEISDRVATASGYQIHWDSGTAEDRATDEKIQKMLERELTCDEVVQIALLRNADLQASYERLGIAQAELVQAGLLRNPVFEAEVHFTGGGIGTGTNLNIVQEFINVFQLPLRKKVAAAEFEAKKLEIAQTVFAHAIDTKKTCYAFQGLQASVPLLEKVIDAEDAALEVAKRQLNAGNTTTLEVLRAESNLVQQRLALTSTVAEQSEVEQRLYRMAGVDKRIRINSLAEELQPMTSMLSELEEQAVQRRFDLIALRHERDALKKQAEMTSSFRLLPEFNLGVDVEGEGESKVVPGPNLSVPIPVFDQGSATTARAAYAVREIERRIQAKEQAVRTEVRAAFASLLAREKQVSNEASELAPLKRKITAEAQLRYNGMLLGVFDLLEIRRDELLLEKQHQESLAGYWTAITELERAVGGKISEGAAHGN